MCSRHVGRDVYTSVCVCASVYLCMGEGLAELLAWGPNCCPGKSRNKASEALSPVWVQMLFAAVVSSSVKKQKEEEKEEEWKCKQRWTQRRGRGKDGDSRGRVKKNTGQEASVLRLPHVMCFYMNELRSEVRSRTKLCGIYLFTPTGSSLGMQMRQE